MASAAAQTYLTSEEYLAFERKATTKHEYVNGHIIAMSGASFAHTFITAHIANQLYNQLIDGECRVATNDMRVKASKTESYFTRMSSLSAVSRSLRMTFSTRSSIQLSS